MRIYRDTLFQLRWTIVSVTVRPGAGIRDERLRADQLPGHRLASAGGFFAFLSPLLGWIGVALTGSDTSSNSLFGQLQVTAAQQTGPFADADGSFQLLGGCVGQDALPAEPGRGSAAVGLDGAESVLFRKLLGWSLGLLAFITVLIFLQSTPVLGWMVP